VPGSQRVPKRVVSRACPVAPQVTSREILLGVFPGSPPGGTIETAGCHPASAPPAIGELDRREKVELSAELGSARSLSRAQSFFVS
jgi:hypothetical protein